MPAASSRFRRAATLVCHWHGERLVIENYRARTRVPAHPLILQILGAFGAWRHVGDAAADVPDIEPPTFARLTRALHRGSFLVRERGPGTTQGDRLGRWASWAPEAPFFHFASRDVAFAAPELSRRLQRAKARGDPPPAPVKRMRALARVKLPIARLDAPLVPTLLARRTWRRFGHQPIELDALGSLLGLTWGVQQWVDGGLFGRIPLKTSPSGGARHSLEVYVLALAVRGLERGWYHYRPDAHRLDLIRRGARRATVGGYLPSQEGYGQAAALFLMSSVIPRVEWRYALSRAYRVVLIEAGHFCQTFCLVATALGLAPFCTAALADSRLEAAVGLDGVDETALYVAGVGSRPPGVDWAPFADSPRTLPRRAAAWTRALGQMRR